MSLELNLSFPTIDHVTVSLNNQTTAAIPFAAPLTTADWQDIQWYLEIYPNQYAADVDDSRADRVVAKLQVWGQLLFNAVFKDLEAARLFNAFQDSIDEERYVSIAASQPEIVRLPWELLCDPNGEFLLHQMPQISLRRQFIGEGGQIPVVIEPKEQLRLLMIVSRPNDTGFIDPRAESQAILRAVEHYAPGRIVIEFLRPATLSKLVERLNNSDLPAIDIVHFDGHGFLGKLPESQNHHVLKAIHNSFSTVHHQLPVTAKNGAVLAQSNPKLQTSYLLFEHKNSMKDPISAQVLGAVFHQQKISLIVLSACDSGTVTGEDALGCAAAMLTYQGIPAVLAMTYAVLTTTAEQLFGKFYGELSKGTLMGTALAIARQDLEQRQGRGLRWRGREQITLNLSDWFLPAFYQAGNDVQLLNKPEIAEPPTMKAEVPWSRFSEVAKEGFFGRSRELWEIERLFAKGWRRFTISGFGGQGKTYLALEAGRWLYQTGMFDVVCFVDYASFQGVEPVDWAVAELSVVLGQSFVDADAVKLGLQMQRTLMILDNLDSLQPEALQDLLTVASGWSEVGETRLLLTTRDKQLNHPDYPIRRNEYLLLKGLGSEEYPEDAINYFHGLMELPPKPTCDLPGRDDLIELLKLVDFHPLSIRLVAFQLKDGQITDLTRSLQEILQDSQGSLVASLNLSLQRLSPDLLAVLPKLAVFQGGAFEQQILKITDFTVAQWNKIRSELGQLGLTQVNQVDNIQLPFIQFHPNLAPLLWERLSSATKSEMRIKHYQQYHALSIYLDNADNQNPSEIRAIARKESPNLLWAVKNAIADKYKGTVDFVDRVNKFLAIFGLREERALLTESLEKLIGEVGSPSWYLVRSNQGKQLYGTGQYTAAAEIFAEILERLGTELSFDRVNTLIDLSQCLRNQGELIKALQGLQTGISLSEQLEQSDQVKRQCGTLQANLGNVLIDMGQYAAAQQAYENSLMIDQELGDQRGAAVAEGQLGTLAMLQNDLATAAQKYQSALQTFQQLQEPQMEAVAWHQLGRVYQESKQWAAADRAYRESASIGEQQGNLSGAASTYGQLAILSEKINKLTDAENWYFKALHIARTVGDRLGESKRLHNLANLLTNQPHRLPEAQKLAQEALAIDQTLDPAAAEIWNTYNLLAKIATAQGENQTAQTYRQQARSAKAAFAGTQYELQQHEPLIAAVVAAIADQTTAEQMEPLLTKRSENGWEQLVIAIRRILAGERAIEALWEDLDADDSMIIQAIIDRLS